jgi:hypothetical protein
MLENLGNNKMHIILQISFPFYIFGFISQGTFFFFFGETGILTQGFILAKKALYHLSHTSSGYFGDGSLVNCFPRLASNHAPPDFSLPDGWDYRHELMSCYRARVE